MYHPLRLAALAACLFGLSACNNLVSVEPWFTAADAQGGPELREGLWANDSDDKCRVDLARPVERWPDCAGPLYIRAGEWWLPVWQDRHGIDLGPSAFEEWGKLPLLLAAGDPLVLQAEMAPDPAPSASDADTIVDDDGEPEWRYSYAAFRPTKFDEQGRVVAFETWEIACGPMSDDAAVAEPVDEQAPEESSSNPTSEADEPGLDEGESLESGYVTNDPFPGLTVVGNHCMAESVAALRLAAASSEAISPHRTMMWVRDGWR